MRKVKKFTKERLQMLQSLQRLLKVAKGWKGWKGYKGYKDWQRFEKVKKVTQLFFKTKITYFHKITKVKIAERKPGSKSYQGWKRSKALKNGLWKVQQGFKVKTILKRPKKVQKGKSF